MYLFELEKIFPFINQLFDLYIIDKWYLLTIYLLLNIIDNLTGWLKSRVNKSINSKKGRIGIYKKLCNWIVILLSFTMSFTFIELGKIVDVDLSIILLLGWFVLGSLIINEINSIIENLVEAGCNVPSVLVRGLEISEKAFNEKNHKNRK